MADITAVAPPPASPPPDQPESKVFELLLAFLAKLGCFSGQGGTLWYINAILSPKNLTQEDLFKMERLITKIIYQLLGPLPDHGIFCQVGSRIWLGRQFVI